jgi:hypothetical protein
MYKFLLLNCSADLHGSNMFTDDGRKLEELCGPNDSIYAVVPSPQAANVPAALAPLIPHSLSRPIHDHVENSKKNLARAMVAQEERRQVTDWEARWAEERNREKTEREEERKREKAEREAERKRDEERWEARWEAKRKEEREREEAARKEERRREETVRDAERKREEAVREEERKQEQAKWEAKRDEERNRERAERSLEKAKADKKYEDLRQHLLEVEEMTMDTVGWIAHNVCHWRFNHPLETDYPKNRIQKCLTVLSCATFLIKHKKCSP